MSLRHILEKIKLFTDIFKNSSDSIIICLICVISILNGFSIGYMSNIPTSNGISVLEAYNKVDFISDRAGDSINAPIPLGMIVASKNGTKYYKSSCSGANRIKEENKVYFQSTEQASKAGYSPAKNCF